MKNNGKKQLALIAHNPGTGMYMERQVKQFLGSYVDTVCWITNMDLLPPEKFTKSDLFVFSNQAVFAYVQDKLPAGKKAFVAERTLNIENIPRMLALYALDKVLVVATSEETALNTIKILKKLGVERLDFTPYWPGCAVDVGKYTAAVTTGMGYLAPLSIKKVIDLGGKGIDISSFSVILNELDIPVTVLDDISNFYLKDIVKNILKLNQVAQKNEMGRKSMSAILSNMSEGIISFDKGRRVVFINAAAEKMLGLSRESSLQKGIHELLPDSDDVLRQLGEPGESADKIVALGGQSYIVKYFLLSGEPLEAAAGVVTLLPVAKVRELDVKVRREMRKRGNRAYYKFEDIIGVSANLLSVIDLAKQFALTDLNILIEGESGVGKELFAQSMHNHSLRVRAPFVAANLASIPANLVESELFGYEEGAFTGARRGGKSGLFEDAHMGTIFLDEIDSASKDVQNRLLRVLEEKEIRRVGGSSVVPVNVRVVAATNVSLHELVKKGEFRLDLFYRLCAVPISIPPLRQRGRDILLLIEKFSYGNYGFALRMSPQLEDFIQKYSWPGNVRELNNLVHYLCNLKANRESVDVADLPKYLQELLPQMRLAGMASSEPVEGGDFLHLDRLLADKEMLGEFTAILEELEISRMLDTNIGRYKLLENLREKKVMLSEYRLKYYLKLLNKHGLAQSGSTRQGTMITDKGLEFIARL